MRPHGWSGFTAYAGDYDQYIYFATSDYTAGGGRQNPSGLSTVYVNCHIGNA